MVQIYNEYDVIINHENKTLKGWVNNCTSCNMELFIEDGVLEGVDISKFPDSEQEFAFRLR